MSRIDIRLAALMLALSAVIGCSDDSYDANSGLEAKFRVLNGQYKSGAFPSDTSPDAAAPPSTPLADGGVDTPPVVFGYDTAATLTKRGTISKGVRVTVTDTATSVAFALEGDPGYWLVPSGIESLEFPGNLDVSIAADFANSLPLGPRKLFVAAIDGRGRVGPARGIDLVITDNVPAATLAVSLEWTSNADLDLVIVQPDGSTLTNKATAATTSPEIQAKIDLDSNANCVLDGHRMENALYTAFPAGEYKVFVRQAQTCGFPSSGWTVRVLRDGNEFMKATGVTYGYEVDLPNGGTAGPGRYALSFNIGG